MKVRIKEKYSYTKSSIVYCVQVKRGLFWKTLGSYKDWREAKGVANDLREIDLYNTYKPKVCYELWAVRPKYSSGYSYKLDLFENYPTPKMDKSDGTVCWFDSGRSERMTLRCDELFDKNVYEPMKVKVTIEKV